VSDEEDADVDSGWDLGDGAPAKSPKAAPPRVAVSEAGRAESSDVAKQRAITEPSRLVAHAKKLIAKSAAPPKPADSDAGATISSKPTDPPPPDPLAATREAPSALSISLDDDLEAPVTRRATEEEMQLATARARPSPASAAGRAGELRDAEKARTVPNRTPALRLGSGRTVTLKAEASAQVKHDSRVHNRPTPPAFAHQPPPSPPPSPAPGAHTSLRFPAASLKDARARRPTTKINLNVAELLGGMKEAASTETAFEEIDLEGNDSRPPRAPISDPPVELDSLDDLPVESAIESARKSAPPLTRRSDLPPSKKTPLSVAQAGSPTPPPRAAVAKPKMSLAERMAGVVDQLTRGEADQRPAPSVPPPREQHKTKELVRSAAPTKPGAKPVEVPRRQSSGRNAQTKKTAPQGLNRAAITPAVSVMPAAVRLSKPPASDVELEVEAVSLSADELQSLESLESPFPNKPVGSMLSLDEPGALSVAGDSAPPLLDESDPPPVPSEPDDPALLPIAQRFERGDYLGALLRAEALLEARPDYAPARRYFESAQELLKQMYLEKLGSGECVLRIAMAPNQIQGLALDHRSGFLISLIDGMATVDEILDMSGMPPLDALRLLYEMREEGVLDASSAS
jgi:hypothetical protein